MSILDRFIHPPAPRIEPVGTEAAARLAAIHASAFARGWSTLDFERLLGERGVVADGLFLGRTAKPVGFTLSRIVLDEAEIITVAIAAEARGKGHARPLLSRHLDELARRGVARVHLEVEDGNAPALAAYRRLGFRDIGRRDGYYQKADGTRVAALTMALDL
ncbi:GNAT family N-acetyltransferase [Microvirga terrae]|uniref:GNAT family N-acetyltransferase n=1 Tax=Microvirga terrae TaxID=2740529 RepID=A0ABY5RS50_9HYPH|nr:MULTISPECIES: GNAT family N-acetyltransferase [Microvirga]MBQ0823647.1 GNAT family N-acetyltransferase [Microvirga sp. HBU67558]UVF19739.1 GNAT family N-acetyltransferase [Microvirga terrae]